MQFAISSSAAARVRLVLAFVLAVVLLQPLTATGAGPASTSILVKFRPGTTAAAENSLNRRHGGVVTGTIRQLGVRIIRVPEGASAVNAARSYGQEHAVSYAEPNASAVAAAIPNDPSYSLQWSLPKIKAPAAWDTTHGSATVRIAVLDTGISLNHPDLAPKILVSKNFSSSASVDDINGHGSHVAGIAAAVTNNGIGVAGLGYDCQLQNVKVLGDDGSGLYSAVAQGITWAADNGANVINLSLVGTSPSSTLQSAVDYAWSKGAVVVAAAGNYANSSPTYPASFAHAVAVAATTDLDRLASFSDYGDWVDVAAPGITIYSTIPGGYGYMSGTSMASPFVAGLAGLLFSRMVDTNGDGKLNDEVRSQIQASADNVGLAGIGSGRINAYRAVTEIGSPPSTTGTISGRITDGSSGLPIAGATVNNGTATVSTDATGGYLFTNLAAGSYAINASASGYASASQTVSVTAGAASTGNFALTRIASGSIVGKVTDTATGLPLPGATVITSSASSTTDSAGGYALQNLVAGTYAVTASATGYATSTATVTISSGQTTTANFALAAISAAAMWVNGITFRTAGPNLRVSATVNSTFGPLAGAQLQMTVTCSNGTTWKFSGSTDSTGTATFAIQKAPRGTYTAAVTSLIGPYPWDATRSAASATFTF